MDLVFQEEINRICDNALETLKNENNLDKESFIFTNIGLITVLQNNFLDVPDSLLFKMMDTIDKINKICLSNNFLSKDFVIQYIKIIIPIKQFISSESISDDYIINQLKQGKFIKDFKRTFLLFEVDLSPEKIIMIFDNLENTFDFISNIKYIDNSDKYKLMFSVSDKFLCESYFEALFFILDYNGINPMINRLKSDVSERLVYLCNRYGVLYENNIEIAKKYGLIFDENIKDNIIEIENKIPRIDYELAINLLNDFFNDKIELDLKTLKLIIRTITDKYLGEHNINDYKIIFLKSDNVEGSENEMMKLIKINDLLLSGLLNKKLDLQQRLKVFEVLFHEIQHVIQHKKIMEDKLDLQTYFMLKESILMDYDIEYYSENYESVIEEIDANKVGFYKSIEFLKQFPILSEQLNFDYSDEHSTKNYFNKKVFGFTVKKEYFDKAFDRLVLFNPDIIAHYPILRYEYTNGGVKYHSISFTEFLNMDCGRILISKQI